MRKLALDIFEGIPLQRRLELTARAGFVALGDFKDSADRAAALATEADATGLTVPIAYSRYMLDVNETIIEVDSRFEEITMYARAEAVGRMNQFDLVPPEDRAHYMLQVNSQLAHGDMAYLRHEILRKDGNRVQVACYGRRYFDSASKDYRSEIIIFQL